jgi:DNA-binding phage protein
MMTRLKTTPFDVADYLDDEETIAEYLREANADPDPAVVAAAKAHAERARLKALPTAGLIPE